MFRNKAFEGLGYRYCSKNVNFRNILFQNIEIVVILPGFLNR